MDNILISFVCLIQYTNTLMNLKEFTLIIGYPPAN